MNLPEQIERELSAFARASAAGASHLALFHLIRCRALRGDLQGADPQWTKPLIVLSRHPSSPAAPVAFLGCFTESAASYVLPLKTGLNRVGRSPDWGDYEEFPRGVRLMEGRQWLIVCRRPEALVADDHSTNLSILLPRDFEVEDSGQDPRVKPEAFSYTRLFGTRQPGRVDLDWAGDVVGSLAEGDVLLTMYGGFVFGWFPSGEFPAAAQGS